MSANYSVQCTNIHKSYGSLEILKGVDLTVENGEIICIVGPSGAGKSTLLHIIGTLDKADKGHVVIGDHPISQYNDKTLSAFRNKHLGFIFQFHHLLPEFTAIENVCIPGFIAKTSEKVVKQRAMELLDFLGLGHRSSHKPSELSGGEQQRVAVARALINQPSLILADEPSGNLDTKNAAELHDLFFQLRKEFGQTFIIVTHNEEFAQQADRTLTMKDGLIIG
ncbi:MAG: ABC transporter ATP-binding protein [Bacteroidetes bacterium]|nr:ABC transporter ATP-binding protein [Bacteroidota bacterium]